MLRIAVGVVLTLLLGYGAVKAWPLVEGPTLSIDSPAPYETLLGGRAIVEGVARHTENLYLNDGPLPIDPGGRFSKTLLLPSGGIILKLVARDRFGRSVTHYRTVYIP